jgi:hypothetical protein
MDAQVEGLSRQSLDTARYTFVSLGADHERSRQDGNLRALTRMALSNAYETLAWSDLNQAFTNRPTRTDDATTFAWRASDALTQYD